MPIRYAGGHLTGRIAEGTTSIDTIGRLAVTDRENLGFQGHVRTIEETEASYSYDPTADRYTLGPSTPSGSRIKFNPDGRIQEENSFFGGRCAGSLKYEYQEDGIEMQQTYIDCDGKHEVSDLSLSDGVDAMASRIHLCETKEMGPANEKYHSVRKYDCSGREVEFSTPGTSHTTVTKHDGEGRDIEELEYKHGALITATRSEYKTNAHGDWGERNETQWNPNFPRLASRLCLGSIETLPTTKHINSADAVRLHHLSRPPERLSLWRPCFLGPSFWRTELLKDWAGLQPVQNLHEARAIAVIRADLRHQLAPLRATV